MVENHIYVKLIYDVAAGFYEVHTDNGFADKEEAERLAKKISKIIVEHDY